MEALQKNLVEASIVWSLPARNDIYATYTDIVNPSIKIGKNVV